MSLLAAALALAGLAAPPARQEPAAAAPPVTVRAELLPGELAVGRTAEVLVSIELAEGVSLAAAGMPGPLLQLDVPPSVRLAGPVLETYAELSRNEFVQEPFERVLRELPARVAFELVGEPAPDETLGLNLVGYARLADGRAVFVRRRLELPLEAGAAALEVPAARSDWGADPALLQLGDRAPDVALPRADGSELRLSSLMGEGRLLVVTYRAHW